MSTSLRKGDSGPRVKALQHALNARPYLNLQEDGKFGPATEQAVKDFQNRVRLIPDGVVGPRTDALLWTRVVIANVRVQAPISTVPQPSVPPPRTILPPAPAPGSATAPPNSGAGFVQQVSIGAQISLAPWLVLPSQSPGGEAIWSGVVSYALVYRTKSDGPHIELALSPQFAVNSRNLSTDPRYGLQVNGQVTFADLVVSGQFHFVSPFLQATAAAAVVPSVGLGAGFAIGNQVAFELVKDRLQLTLQFGVGAQWSNLGRPDASFSVVGQGAVGTTIQF